MKLFTKIIIICLALLTINACKKEKPPKPPKIFVSVIDESRIIRINIAYNTLNDRIKIIPLNILDVTALSAQKIFAELLAQNFPIYSIDGYSSRFIVNDSLPSLHAYGAAIDVNEYMNPYYNVFEGRRGIIPERFTDRVKDEAKIREDLKNKHIEDQLEVDAVLGSIMQPNDSEDWFINRHVSRPGMITPKEAEIFITNGFTIWGGAWRQPMDFMHFQIPRKLAQILASNTVDQGSVIWENHVLISKASFMLKKKLETVDVEIRKQIWEDHLNKCQLDDTYLAAANTNETTALCLSDCDNKLLNILPRQ